jgi:gliding motility-associated-like protein
MRKILLAIILLTWYLPSQGQVLMVDFSFDEVCLGQTTHFISHCYIADTSGQSTDSITSVAWDLKGDGKFNDGNDTINSVVFTSPGVHNVGLRAITRNGLAKALYKLVPVNYLRPVFSSKSSCYQQPVTFTNKTEIQGDTTVYYLWKFGDGQISAEKNPQHLFADSGHYSVVLYASFLTGCEDSVRHIVVVPDFPSLVVEFSGDTVMKQGDSLFASLQGTYDSVIWSTKATSYTIMIKKAGYYSVMAYKNSCSGQAGFTVTVRERGPDPVIGNIFTPNGDGHNDLWEILNLSDFKPCQVNVFDRYGTEVFSSSDYKNDWNGSFNGKQLANDTYYYFVRCYNDVTYKGNVNILK